MSDMGLTAGLELIGATFFIVVVLLVVMERMERTLEDSPAEADADLGLRLAETAETPVLEQGKAA